MPEDIIDIHSISDLHHLYGAGSPKHPLITIIDLAKFQTPRVGVVSYRLGFYSIFSKKFNGLLRYGRSYYDFSEGSMMFTAPGQVTTTIEGPTAEEGWGLFFHADLINNSPLGNNIHNYSFFQYEANEALHVSEDEKATLIAVLDNIRKEYAQNIDQHTQSLIQTNIELLLNYCSRFYDRQFYTRQKVSTDAVQQFEKALREYFNDDLLINKGLPNVKYFADLLSLSPNYLSDLLHKYTGKSTQEHIHLQLVEKAKSLLWSTNQSVSEIAYALGFEHPSQFTRLFKQKTGFAPSGYRLLN